jgi:hypothetical protein
MSASPWKRRPSPDRPSHGSTSGSNRVAGTLTIAPRGSHPASMAMSVAISVPVRSNFRTTPPRRPLLTLKLSNLLVACGPARARGLAMTGTPPSPVAGLLKPPDALWQGRHLRSAAGFIGRHDYRTPCHIPRESRIKMLSLRKKQKVI